MSVALDIFAAFGMLCAMATVALLAVVIADVVRMRQEDRRRSDAELEDICQGDGP